MTELPSLEPLPHVSRVPLYSYSALRALAPAAAQSAIRLDSNEGALGPSPRSLEACASIARGMHRYPDPSVWDLRHAIAALHDIDPARIVCGTGSEELLGLLIRAFAGSGHEVLHSAHAFQLYALAASAAGASAISAPERDLHTDVEAMLAAVTERTRVVVIANPNNPTGSCLTRAQLGRLHAALPPTVLLVIDAAYAEYATFADYADGLELARLHPNVAVTRTFSKVYAMAGLRLGWMYAAQPIVEAAQRIRAVFGANAMAQSAAVAALSDQDWIRESVEHNARWREWTTDALRDLGLKVYPSAGNFLLFSTQPPQPAAAVLVNALQRSHGILVRHAAASALPQSVRVTIGTEPELKAFVAAVASCTEK